MKIETREAIEIAYNHFQLQMGDEGIDMTDAGKLMYSLVVATLELDDKLNAIENGMRNAIGATQYTLTKS